MNHETHERHESGIGIVGYSEERRQEVVDLLNLCLGQKVGGERDERYWEWKHERSAFGPSIMLLAESEGRLVGVRAFMRWRLRRGDQVLEVAKPVDTVTHPEFQRRGIFSQLTLAACEHARTLGVRFLFNTPNRNSRPGYLKLGWHDVGRIPLYGKVLRPASAALRLAQWKLRGGAAPHEEEVFRERPVPAAEVFENSSAMEKLLETRRREPGLETDRSIEFLRWRYAGHPTIRYYAEAIGMLDGVLIYRTSFRRGLREIMVDDLIVRRPELGQELLRMVATRVNAEYIVACRPGPGLSRIPGMGIRLTARELGSSTPALNGWALCLGDVEGL